MTCGYIVLATHTPLMGNAGTGERHAVPDQACALHDYVVGGRVEKGRIPDALFWDTADPYHYLRIEPNRDHDLVIFGGEITRPDRCPPPTPVSTVWSGR